MTGISFDIKFDEETINRIKAQLNLDPAKPVPDDILNEFSAEQERERRRGQPDRSFFVKKKRKMVEGDDIFDEVDASPLPPLVHEPFGDMVDYYKKNIAMLYGVPAEEWRSAHTQDALRWNFLDINKMDSDVDKNRIRLTRDLILRVDASQKREAFDISGDVLQQMLQENLGPGARDMSTWGNGNPIPTTPEDQDKLPVIDTNAPGWEIDKEGLPKLPPGFAWANDVAGIIFIKAIPKKTDISLPKHHRMMFINAISNKLNDKSDPRWRDFLLNQAARLETLVKILRMMADFVGKEPEK